MSISSKQVDKIIADIEAIRKNTESQGDLVHGKMDLFTGTSYSADYLLIEKDRRIKDLQITCDIKEAEIVSMQDEIRKLENTRRLLTDGNKALKEKLEVKNKELCEHMSVITKLSDRVNELEDRDSVTQCYMVNDATKSEMADTIEDQQTRIRKLGTEINDKDARIRVTEKLVVSKNEALVVQKALVEKHEKTIRHLSNKIAVQENTIDKMENELSELKNDTGYANADIFRVNGCPCELRILIRHKSREWSLKYFATGNPLYTVGNTVSGLSRVRLGKIIDYIENRNYKKVESDDE